MSPGEQKKKREGLAPRADPRLESCTPEKEKSEGKDSIQLYRREEKIPPTGADFSESSGKNLGGGGLGEGAAVGDPLLFGGGGHGE